MATKNKLKHAMIAAVVCLLLSTVRSRAAPQEPYWSVRSFGAKGDGVSVDTNSVQRAIDACAGEGGGDVVFPAGRYLCRSLHLRSNITLRLQAGSVILGIRDNALYDPPETLGFKNDSDEETSFFHHALIWGEDLERVSIVGEGEIDANFAKRRGPKPIALKRCKMVKIEGITIRNAPNYNISLLGTDYVLIDGVTILNGYADGIDPDSCRNLRISNCHIESMDDAIVLKSSFSLGVHRSCENVSVTNCFLSTPCNCFKLGTESGGDFKHIAVDNCVMSGLKGDRPASSGIAIESVDGANVAGVTVSNISMFNVCSPVFMRLGNRGRDMAVHTPGSLRNVSISHVVVEDASVACTITGIPDHPIEDVSLSDVRVEFRGGAMLRAATEPVPENAAAYPDPDMFGPLPADGIYARHVNGLRLTDVNLQTRPGFWRLDVPDDRVVDWKQSPPTHSHPASPQTEVVIEDADDLQIHNFMCWNGPKNLVQIRLRNVTNSLLDTCRMSHGHNRFVEIAGIRSNKTELTNCNIAPGAVSVADGARRSGYSIR